MLFNVGCARIIFVFIRNNSNATIDAFSLDEVRTIFLQFLARYSRVLLGLISTAKREDDNQQSKHAA